MYKFDKSEFPFIDESKSSVATKPGLFELERLHHPEGRRVSAVRHSVAIGLVNHVVPAATVVRYLLSNCELFANYTFRYGDVWVRWMVEVHPDFRRLGLVRAIHTQEEREICPSRGLHEIWMLIRGIGYTIWTKAESGYRIGKLELLFLRIRYNKLRRADWPPADDVSELAHFPIAFWTMLGGDEHYTTLLYKPLKEPDDYTASARLRQ